MIARHNCWSGLALYVAYCGNVTGSEQQSTARAVSRPCVCRRCRWNWRWRCASYSEPTRRRNSRQTTRSATPMHEAANMALFVMCHDEERKQASMVYQFHSICLDMSMLVRRLGHFDKPQSCTRPSPLTERCSPCYGSCLRVAQLFRRLRCLMRMEATYVCGKINAQRYAIADRRVRRI